MSEGDVVRGCRVRKIQVDGVEFEKDGKIWVQKVNGGCILLWPAGKSGQ